MMAPDTPLDQLIERASDAAEVMKLLGHEQRLLILCRLSQGEMSVGRLVDACGQSQSSVSQHLGKLREGGMVSTRREGTTIYYGLAHEGVRQLIDMLCDRFGPTAHSAFA
jgi:DNA-binding transcriptional ArsR family regulator